MNFLNLIRWKNLLMIALSQLLLKYALLEPFGVSTSLDILGISLLILATLCIAAAGNIINDLNDIETDTINKPNSIIVGKSISEKSAYYYFIMFNIVGVGVGFYLSHLVNKSAFFSLFVIVSILLYVYATYLKRTFLIGNLVVSALVALSLIFVGIFDLIPSLTSLNRETQLTFFNVILDYALFAFLLNLLREITKDIEDINGDFKAGMKTIPLVLGRERTKYILAFLNIVILVGIIVYVINSLYTQLSLVIYFLIFIIAPLIFTSVKIFNADSNKEVGLIKNLYKWIMLFGMLSLLLYKYIILN
ncbi:geranylgeranylglycerol-phosphate geranylgeranyltransferase [Hyunsoonleella aestuarii]|nr:geranylgeranylglycerol-phosphate geranylgeranyltransferase [Hyunsoonleella aestuarii]